MDPIRLSKHKPTFLITPKFNVTPSGFQPLTTIFYTKLNKNFSHRAGWPHFQILRQKTKPPGIVAQPEVLPAVIKMAHTNQQVFAMDPLLKQNQMLLTVPSNS